MSFVRSVSLGYILIIFLINFQKETCFFSKRFSIDRHIPVTLSVLTTVFLILYISQEIFLLEGDLLENFDFLLAIC